MTTLGFRLSRYRVNPAMLDDFPRYHPRAAARCRSGFTDISRYGLVFTYPTRNFAWRVRSLLIRLSGRHLFASLHVAMQPGPSLQPLPAVWRMVSEDSARGERPFLLIVRTRRIVTVDCSTSSAGCTEFPAYSQILLGQLSYLRTVIVTAAVYRGFISELAPLHLTFRHRAGVSPYTSAYALAETCVFSKQSDGPFLCGPRQLPEQVGSPSRAPLLPKLQGHFAEFLSHVSLDRLGILFPPTCVGLRYGHPGSR